MRLWYLFWAVPLFLAGCGESAARYAYRPSVLYRETAEESPAGLVLNTPSMPAANGLGYDEVDGLSLNQRRRPRVTGGYTPLGETIYSRTIYSDIHPDDRWDDGNLHRHVYSYSQRLLAR
jgi:hypothetical protein